MILHEFITANRDEIIARCRARIATRPAPKPTDVELEHGVPLFLDQLAEALTERMSSNPGRSTTATQHGGELHGRGFTIAQVVHDYGNICQVITEMAVETDAPITPREFQTMNMCLDDAIADAVTEYSALRATEETERLGRLAHELRNQLSTAFLSFDILRTGTVGVDGSTGKVLGRSLHGLRNLIDRELAEVRLGAGIHNPTRVGVAELVEDLEVSGLMEARAHGIGLSVPVTVDRDVTIDADRQILSSVVGNLLQNAFKFTPKGGQVEMRAIATADRVRIEVEDQCGGLPPGKSEELFAVYSQKSADRSGLGLGLSICLRGVKVNGGEISVKNRPGIGCVFCVDLPRHTA